MLELYREGVISSEEALRRRDAACELLTREETQERFGVFPASDYNVLYQPEAGIVYAERAMHAFAQGLNIVEGTADRVARRGRGAGRRRLRGAVVARAARGAEDRPPGRRDARDDRLLRARRPGPVGRRRGRPARARVLLALRPCLRAQGRKPYARQAGGPGRRRGRRPWRLSTRSSPGPRRASRRPGASPSTPRAASTRRPTTSGSSSSDTGGSSSGRRARGTASSSRRRWGSSSPRSRQKRSN